MFLHTKPRILANIPLCLFPGSSRSSWSTGGRKWWNTLWKGHMVFFQMGKRGYGSLTHDRSMGLVVNFVDEYTIVPWILWVMMEIGKFVGFIRYPNFKDNGRYNGPGAKSGRTFNSMIFGPIETLIKVWKGNLSSRKSLRKGCGSFWDRGWTNISVKKWCAVDGWNPLFFWCHGI